MERYLIFGVVTFLAVFLFSFLKKTGENVKPNEQFLPSTKIENDKLVFVEDVSEDEIKKIVQGFCDSYNEHSYKVIPLLSKLTERNYAISFPYDVNFEIYCYFINYVNYPMDFDRKFKATGWATVKATDAWRTPKSVNKRVMLYCSAFDEEFDNVFMTTSDNIGYKLGFAMGEEKQLLSNPEKQFVEAPVSMNDLETVESWEFK